MHFIRLIVFFALLLMSQTADSQVTAMGFVLDAETLEPVIGASISDERSGKVITVTNSEGQFQIPKNDEPEY